MPNYNRSSGGRFISLKEKNRREKVSLSKRKHTPKADEVDCCIGRRIVNIQHLGLEMWCFSCDIPLSFRDVEDERRQGLLSVLYVRCRACLALKSISTDTKTGADQKLNDANHKAAIALNIPNPSKNLYKRDERKIGPVLESIADESSQEALELEKSLTQQSPLDMDNFLSYGDDVIDTIKEELEEDEEKMVFMGR